MANSHQRVTGRRTRHLLMASIVLALISALVSGCWDYRELDELAHVMALGIDKAKEGDQTEITVQIVKPSAALAAAVGGGGGEDSAVWVVSAEGETVIDALRNLALEVSREPSFSHCRIVVFGEEYARGGLGDALEALDRQEEFRRRTWLLTAKGTAKEVLEAETELEKVPANALFAMIRSREITALAGAMMLSEFLPSLTSPGVDGITSRIELVEPPSPPEGGQGEGGGQGGTAKPPEKPKPRLTGTAVYRRDKLQGWLDERETRGLLWGLGEARGGLIVVKSPLDEQDKIGLEVERITSSIDPIPADSSPSFRIRVVVEGDVAGTRERAVNLINENIIDSLERRMAEVIRNEIDAALKKAQTEYKSDIFGLGEALRRRHPDAWRNIRDNWSTMYSRVPVDVHVVAELRRVGLSL